MNDLLKAKLLGLGAAVVGFAAASGYGFAKIKEHNKQMEAADKWIMENITIYPINCNGYSLEGIGRADFKPKKLVAEDDGGG